MTTLADLLHDAEPVAAHRPWPRVQVDRGGWERVTEWLAAGDGVLLGLWAREHTVHMALRERDGAQFAVLTLPCPQGRYPSVSARHAPAQRLERAIADLHGLQAEGLGDTRPWLDHGRWGLRHPLGDAAPAADGPAAAYPFLAAEGPQLHHIPVGPVHAGIIEPGHFRFSASGETVVRLEQRLGYTHRGIEHLMAGADLTDAARITARAVGDSTVAYSLAFARAVEVALGVEPPPRAQWLRALMAELERVANHLGDIGAICNDAAFALMHAHCGILREQVLRACDACFGHRMMRDRVIPGGVQDIIAADLGTPLGALVESVQGRFPALVELYDRTASLQDRTVGTGIVRPDLARVWAPGGFVGRASGGTFDARRLPGQAPYDTLEFEVPVLTAGDVDARVWIRIREVEQSLSLIGQILAHLPAGPVRTPLPVHGGEGTALAESFRGEVLAWVSLAADGRVRHCHLRDPSWFQWPLLEAAIEGNIVADFPLCNKSFNCAYAGHDL